ncbi:DUF1428 domain-containing protein [Agaribacter marinus]|uniref:RNA signal recognition particle 4.5S RNA n=1 Tax=Agaribacter marinus TaxID=1431249 RepID=A0AA37WJ48_9ALTE|nr:DUF1428 domain-containing protein [Agaribacter marinus]GLR72676.1 hypothetical protein GCM10007852_35840 [Agaribacter marinus]
MYLDIYVVPVKRENKEKYIEFALFAADIIKQHGALSVKEAWEDDVPDGELTSIPMAVKKEDDEAVVVGSIEWTSKDIRDKGWEKIMSDEALSSKDMPFDGKRMIFGGFSNIVDA